MKNIIVILLILFFDHNLSIAQTSEGYATDSAKLFISGFGKAVGSAATLKIGKEGGTIRSDDGRVEVIFPEGALKKKTEISIQPVSNTMPGANGPTYHLQPAGLQFEKPAGIVFHYNEDELSGNSPELLGIAMQDEKGQWHGLRDFTIDSINKTIKGSINHFSYWVNYFTASITPESARLKVNKELMLQINSYSMSNDEELPPLSIIRASIPPVWTVNGITNGNAAVGTVRTNNQVPWASLFRAPAALPARNPVAVTTEIKGLNFKIGSQTFTSLKLISNILIYDKAYEVKLESWNDNTSAGMCTMRITDNASFVVQLEGNRPKVVDVQNSLLQQPVKAGCPCSFIWINRPICNGPIHIAPVQSTVLVPANPPGQPYNQVKIMFQPMSTMLPVFQYTCPKSNGVTPSFAIPAMPRYVEFYTKNEKQVIMEAGDDSNGFKMTVEPMREEE